MCMRTPRSTRKYTLFSYTPLFRSGRGGCSINVTSIEGVRAAPGYAAYAAAKAGVISFTQTAALELAPHDIRVKAGGHDAHDPFVALTFVAAVTEIGRAHV